MTVAIDLDLETKCWCCDGTGKPVGPRLEPFTNEDGSCSLCKGSGWTKSDLGDKVLAFLRHHLKPECFKAPAP